MARLIDADKLIVAIVNRTGSTAVLFNTVEELNAYLEGCAYKQNVVLDIIDEQPTAYDVDAVAGRLEAIKPMSTPFSNAYDNGKRNGYRKAIDRAIKIVRKGGSNE